MFTAHRCCRRRVATTPPWMVHTILLIALLGMMPDGSALAGNLDLSAYRGKVVYLDFWASWCAPCRESFPWLGDLVHEYGAQNLVVIAVNVDHDRQRAERFLSATPANFPIIYDPHGEIAAAYKVVGMPSAVLIDRAGTVRFHHDGFSAKRKETYAEHLQTLISEPAS
jgi:cytochrome c biogenesis protein CcmG/thiol:disulfide interchange protein DsbE